MVTQTAGKFIEVDISKIIPTKDNPRTINEKSEEFLKLANSIKSQGVLIPVHIRELTTEGNLKNSLRKGLGVVYQLLAGERRYRAAKKIGLGQLPAINHGQISDEKAFEITFTENFAREDLTALEEGRAVATLLGRYKGDTKAVACRMGHSEKWVRTRSLIEINLSEEWQKEAAENADLEYLTAAHLALIARFPRSVQDQILKSMNWELTQKHLSVKGLEESVGQWLLLIAKAPFDTKGCMKCEKRSGCQPMLWADNKEESSGKNDKCLDRKCWYEKKVAEKKKAFAEKKKKYPELVCVATEQIWGDQEKEVKGIYGKYLSNYKYDKCKKCDKGAVPGLVVNGKGSSIIYIKVNKQSSNDNTSKATPLKELRAELERKRWRKVGDNFREIVGNIKYSQIKHKDPVLVVLTMAAINGSEPLYGEEKNELVTFYMPEKDIKKAVQGVAEILWKKVADTLQYDLDVSGDKDSVKEQKCIAGLFDIDIDKMYKEVCQQDEFKEPEGWKSLKADGTAKKVKKQAAGKGQKAKEKISA